MDAQRIDALLGLAGAAYATGNLHAACDAWRQVLAVAPDHGGARECLVHAESELERSLDDAFAVVEASTPDLLAADGPGLPEAELELAAMATLEEYDAADIWAATPPPPGAAVPGAQAQAPSASAPAPDPEARTKSTLGLSREDTNPRAIVPGYGGLAAEAPPTRSARPSMGVFAEPAGGGEEGRRAEVADEEALDAFFAKFEAGPETPPAGRDTAADGEVGYRDHAVLPPVLSAAQLLDDLPADDDVLPDLGAAPVAPVIDADPSQDLELDADPLGAGATPLPDLISEDRIATPDPTPALRAPTEGHPAPGGLSGVVKRRRQGPPSQKVVEQTRSWSRVDLLTGESDRERRGATAELVSGPDDAPVSALGAAALAFQQGDPIAAYDRVRRIVDETADRDAEDPEARGAAAFLDRLSVVVERALLERVGPTDAVPSLAMTSAGLTGLELDHRDGFVLSQIDGFVSFDDILDLSGMERLRTLRILVKLLDARVITR